MASSVMVTLRQYTPIQALGLTLGFLIGYPLVKAAKSVRNLRDNYKVLRSLWRLSAIGAAAYAGFTFLAPVLGMGALGAAIAVSYAAAYVAAFTAKHIARGISYFAYGVLGLSYGDVSVTVKFQKAYWAVTGTIGGTTYAYGPPARIEDVKYEASVTCPTNPEKYRPVLITNPRYTQQGINVAFAEDHGKLLNCYNEHLETGRSATAAAKRVRDSGGPRA